MTPEQHDDHVWARRFYVMYLRGFYAWMLENQLPLGREFETVLHDNLWDLYAR